MDENMSKEEEFAEDFKALQDVTFSLNDLICVVSYGGYVPKVEVEYDEQGRPQVVIKDLEE